VRVYLPPVVAAEMLSGTLDAGQRADLEDLLADLPLCRAGLDHWFRVGRLRGVLRAARR
jgi:predicted nucleic acid-binding protein